MKIQPECLPCLIRRSLYEIGLVTDDTDLIRKTMIKAMETLVREFDPDRCSATVSTEVHRVIYKNLGNRDPYRSMKERSNRVALSLLPKVEKMIRNSEDHLKAAVIASIVGNILDFGIEGGSAKPEKLLSDFEDLYRKGLKYSDYERFKEILSKSKLVLYITDNCGEIVFDKILCREIKKFNPDMKLLLVVKGEPILSDATREDAELINFGEVVDGILDTGTFAVGLDINNIPEDLRDNLDRADLLICKGMANYEVFSELNYRPIAHLLRVKCKAISRSIGIEVNTNALKIFE